MAILNPQNTPLSDRGGRHPDSATGRRTRALARTTRRACCKWCVIRPGRLRRRRSTSRSACPRSPPRGHDFPAERERPSATARRPRPRLGLVARRVVARRVVARRVAPSASSPARRRRPRPPVGEALHSSRRRGAEVARALSGSSATSSPSPIRPSSSSAASSSSSSSSSSSPSSPSSSSSGRRSQGSRPSRRCSRRLAVVADALSPRRAAGRAPAAAARRRARRRRRRPRGDGCARAPRPRPRAAPPTGLARRGVVVETRPPSPAHLPRDRVLGRERARERARVVASRRRGSRRRRAARAVAAGARPAVGGRDAAATARGRRLVPVLARLRVVQGGVPSGASPPPRRAPWPSAAGCASRRAPAARAGSRAPPRGACRARRGHRERERESRERESRERVAREVAGRE